MPVGDGGSRRLVMAFYYWMTMKQLKKNCKNIGNLLTTYLIKIFSETLHFVYNQLLEGGLELTAVACSFSISCEGGCSSTLSIKPKAFASVGDMK